MRASLIAVILILAMACPTQSHGFGILRYAWDFVKDQVGYERGPRPKIFKKRPNQYPCAVQPPRPNREPAIKAEGY